MRPIRELKKHCPDWEIDERPTIIPEIEKYKDKSEFTASELEAAFKNVCQYDIVFSSYQANPTLYTLLQVARDKAGVQYIMDVDDDMFAINPDNPVWTQMTDEKIYFMQRMIANNDWISTTTSELAEAFIKRRKGHARNSVFINPNFISHDYKHDTINNGDKLIIGYFGGSAHYLDLHDSGFLPALARIMHEYKHVYFESVGMVVDDYLPRSRVKVTDGKKGDGWTNEVFPNMQFDIAVAPLLDNIFNNGKSNIKWQESTRMGSAFVCSDIGPYKNLKDTICEKVKLNTEDAWYESLKYLVDHKRERRAMVALAKRELYQHWRLETHWKMYRHMFEAVLLRQPANMNA